MVMEKHKMVVITHDYRALTGENKAEAFKGVCNEEILFLTIQFNFNFNFKQIYSLFIHRLSLVYS